MWLVLVMCSFFFYQGRIVSLPELSGCGFSLALFVLLWFSISDDTVEICFVFGSRSKKWSLTPWVNFMVWDCLYLPFQECPAFRRVGFQPHCAECARDSQLQRHPGAFTLLEVFWVLLLECLLDLKGHLTLQGTSIPRVSSSFMYCLDLSSHFLPRCTALLG